MTKIYQTVLDYPFASFDNSSQIGLLTPQFRPWRVATLEIVPFAGATGKEKQPANAQKVYPSNPSLG